MTTRDLLRATMTSQSLTPAVRNSSATGLAVDLIGYDAAVIAVSFGTYTDGTHTPSVQHSMDGVSFTACTASDLDGTLSAVNAASSANSIQQVGYIGTQRYVQVVMTISGASTGAASSASIIAGHPRNAPTQGA